MPYWQAGATLAGGLLSSSGAKKSAAQTAEAMKEAAKIQAYSSSLRPVGIKTGVGDTSFTYETGPGGVQRVSGAEINLDPRLTALQDINYAIAPEILQGGIGLFNQQIPYAQQAAQNLYNLSSQVLPTSADLGQRAKDIAAEQFALMDPQRQREEQRLGASVFARGRPGLNISNMGQPELFGLSRGRAEQDAALTAAARDKARSEFAGDIQLGTGLLTSASQAALSPYQTLQGIYAPYNTAMAGITGIEDIGTGLLNKSLALGGGNPAQNIGSLYSDAAKVAGQGQSDYYRALAEAGTNFLKGAQAPSTNWYNPNPGYNPNDPYSYQYDYTGPDYVTAFNPNDMYRGID